MPLLEQGLAWTDRIILFGRNDHFFGWYLALNPKGGVPTVAHDRNPIGDSSVINEYLEDVFPERQLRLGNTLEHMRAWRQYIVKCRRLRPAIGLAYFRVDLPHVWDWYQRMQRRRAFATTYYRGTRELGPSC
jgi:glutathione S-transferase